MCGTNQGVASKDFTFQGQRLSPREVELFGPSRGLIKNLNNVAGFQRILAHRNRSKENQEQVPAKISTSNNAGLSITRTGSGTRASTRTRAKARQSRTKRFTTR